MKYNNVAGWTLPGAPLPTYILEISAKREKENQYVIFFSFSPFMNRIKKESVSGESAL